MRFKLLLVLVACTLLVGAAAPAIAAQEPEGERINVLFGAPDEYPADEPFFVFHGWADFPQTSQPGRFDFTLEIDGVDQGAGKLFNAGPGLTGGVWSRVWLFNYPDGLAEGTHTFTGHWWGPCRWAVDNALWVGDCPTPNAQVEVLTLSHEVVFTP